MGYFDNSIQCWKVLGGFRCLGLVLGGCVWFWLFWVVVASSRWFWLVVGGCWMVVGGFG